MEPFLRFMSYSVDLRWLCIDLLPLKYMDTGKERLPLWTGHIVRLKNYVLNQKL